MLQREMQIPDAKYRELLMEAAGITSAKDIGSQDQFDAVMSALRLGEVVEQEPKTDWAAIYNPPKEVEPWRLDYDPIKLANFGNLIDQYEAQGIIIVAVWPAYGEPHIKWKRKRG